jgi:hypothetical protein
LSGDIKNESKRAIIRQYEELCGKTLTIKAADDSNN